MVHVYEFEIFEDEGWFVAMPFDLEGGTQGETLNECCEMVGDWLQDEMEHREMHGLGFPDPTFGNEPRYGGKVYAFVVSADRDSIRKVTASEAARRLGVTPGRVTQMLDASLLDGYREGRRTWITVDSINARIAESPKAGRPRQAVEA